MLCLKIGQIASTVTKAILLKGSYLISGTTGYMADLFVSQLEKDAEVGGSVIRTYQLHHCFPTNVSAIDLAYDSNDQFRVYVLNGNIHSSLLVLEMLAKATGTN
ncbi:MAG: hypothetical protein CM15mV89_1660 [Caudoviricetes sp.]|nr:MAG: hypothetical protein CM15mV89_1660 [Caudoviricetes sp.]